VNLVTNRRDAATLTTPVKMTPLDTHPDRDATTLLTTPPQARPFPVLADADELIREISHRARTGHEPLLWSLARLGWARVLATDRVAEEVERNLPAVAAGREYEAAVIWRSEYRPLIRWVTVPERGEGDFGPEEAEVEARVREVSRRHRADSPTAELALICAPCFVLTGNRKHLHVSGFGDPGTADAIKAAADRAELELTGMRAISLTEPAVAGAWHGGRRLAKLAAERPIVGALLFLGLIFLARVVDRNRAEIGAALRRAGAVALEQAEAALERHRELTDTLAPSLVLPPQEPSPATLVGGRLARAGAPRTAASVAVELGLGADEVLEVLRAHEAFCFWPDRGWTLGRHLG
jgi:hypothetical protein